MNLYNAEGYIDLTAYEALSRIDLLILCKQGVKCEEVRRLFDFGFLI